MSLKAPGATKVELDLEKKGPKGKVEAGLEKK